MMKLRCWLIGNQGLLMQCGQALVERGHIIAGVTSKAGDIVQWAAGLGVAVNASARTVELLPLVSAARPDLLFSIGNDEILRPSILTVPRIAAVNYHDGPLPLYAGVHATTWALLAGEKQHGVTWHRITSGIDEGAILSQCPVPIEPGDTAFLLNLRCHEAGFETFLELLRVWETGGTHAERSQDLSRRTLYPRFERPPNALVLDWTQPSVELDRLCRATNFGGRPNPFGIARALLNGQFFSILETGLGRSRTSAAPGTVLHSTPRELCVATGEGALAIRRVAGPDGQPLAEIPILQEGSQIPLLTPERALRLHSMFLQSLRMEDRTEAAYTSVPRFALPEWMLAVPSNQRAPLQCIGVAIPEGFKRSGDFLLGCFVAFWIRRCAAPPFRVDLILFHEEGIFAPSSPLVAKQFEGSEVIEACNSARDAIRSAIDAGPVLGDFFLRRSHVGRHESGIGSDLSLEVRGGDLDSAPATHSALHLAATQDGAHARLWLDASRVASSDAARIAAQFSRFLDAVLHHPQTPLFSVPLLDDHEYRLAIQGCNDSAVPYPLDRTFPDLFLDRVRETPEATAVLFEGQSLTYAELNRRAAACALQLSELGIAPGEPAGVFLERSAELIVAIIAVLKTGAIYLPLDPIYPDARLEEIIEDTGATLLISEAALQHRLTGYAGQRLLVDTSTRALRSPTGSEGERFLYAHPDAHPDRPAYLICTSGSTGKPKGVPILHRSLTNLLLSYAERTGFNASDRLMAVSSIGFDWSILDLFLPLAHGARLEVLSSAAIRDGQQLAERAESGEVTFLQGTPGTWRLMLAGGWSKPGPITLACGGESLSRDLASKLHQRVQCLFHVYGPTETAVVSSGDLLEPGGALHLGRPLANYRQYVLDNHLNPVAPGEVGEICIAGVGVSPGYLRRPELNARKFLADPFRPGSGELLYRSGDMGRLCDDGTIQFAGRRDQQVKLRGFRIELEEIESRLMQSAGVLDAVVVLRKDAAQQERLVGFVVMKSGARFSEAALLSELALRLPEYMVPSALVALDALPLTVNKKVDRRHLATATFAPLETVKDKPASGPATNASAEREIVAILANLLGLEPGRIDCNRNFMELGLDSIQLTGLTFALRGELGLKVKLTTLYQHPTPRALANFLFAPITTPLRDSTEFPLSSIQRLIWTHEQLHPGATAWHSPFAFHLNRDVHLENLRKAIETVVHRYSILRSAVDAPEGEPRQRILPPAPFQMLTREIATRQMHNELRRFARLPFTDIPIRAGIFTAGRATKTLIVVVHHRVQDGVSMQLLWDRIESAYSALQEQRLPELPPDQPYQALVKREQAWLQSEEAKQHRAWWREASPASDETAVSAGSEPSCACVEQRYGRWRELQERCRNHSLTPAAAGLAAWALLLVRRNGRRSTTITLPAIRRPLPNDAAAMGNYLNLIPVRIDIPAGATVAQLWEITRQALAEALDHADLPFAEILQTHNRTAPKVAFYGPVGTGNGPVGPLFGSPIHEIMQEGEIALALEMIPELKACRFQLKYDTHHHTPAAASRTLDEFVALLNSTLADPSLLVDELPLMSAEARKQVVAGWNRTAARFPLKTPVHELIARQTARTPAAIAVLDAKESLTYLDLEKLANRIANALRSREYSGLTVGVLMERSIHLPAVLLGILKAGGHYLPLDPGFPRDRLHFLLEDSKTALVILEDATRHLLPAGASQMVSFEDLLSEADSDEAPPAQLVEIAYLIYTSGSTGQPKGTLIPHRALTNFLCAMRRTIPLKPADRLLAVTTISFDIAGLEIFLPLICGASVDIAPSGMARDGVQLRHAIEARSISMIQATPATYRMLLDAEWSPAAPLRILCGGEALPFDLAQRLMRDGAELWNLYGPTEATIWATAQRILPRQKITIGRPIANTKAYVLDSKLQPVPPGVAGELFLAGECLAAGYYRRPELTAAQFVRNPFGPGRMYRTGDLAEWTDDGVLVHLGRADQQIKLRGMRIEIGEIEAALRKLEAVRDAAVILKTDHGGHEQLVAFVERSRRGVDWNPRAELAAWLPSAMVPSRFIDLNEMPLTPNCKIDRRALAALPLDAPPQLLAPSAPETAAGALGAVIAEALGEVVGMDPASLGRDRHLGEYGLDSIRFTRLAVLLSRRLEQTVEPPLFYEFTTLAALEKHFAAKRKTDDSPAPASASTVATLSTASSPVEQSRDGAGAGTEPVAIVGISGIFAGSESLEEFWQHLIAGDDMVTATPASRWTGPQPGWGSFVESITEFDNAFFGISPREAEQMDPQQRLLLRCIWRLFENAGHAPADFGGTSCGVYVGASGFDYNDLLFRRDRVMEPHTLSGASHAVLANRVSFLYDLRGPSAAIDTACSSSLVAIHRAAAAIRSGECTAAIAGGVSVILSPAAQIALRATNMLSPEGRCKTFDASADGYVRGEGAALVLLRPLSAALKDRDRILGILRGSAENHGGRTNSLTAPSVSAQAEVIAGAHRQAGVDPRSITYIEAHGTGTALGDPIEVNGLKNAFAALYAEQGLDPSESPSSIALGSLKTNFGHLEAAAGVAGLIKVLLAMRHGQLPGSLHLRQQNPMIKLEGSPFRLLKEAERWSASEPNLPLRAGISSFGFGGSNAHLVVESPPAPRKRTTFDGALLIPLSGSDAARTASQCHALATWLASAPEAALRDVAFTLQHGRAALEQRVVFVARKRADLIAALQKIEDRALPGRPVSLLADSAAEPALEAIALRWLAGDPVTWPEIPLAQRVDLPGHPFERTIFSLEIPASGASVSTQPAKIDPLPAENRSNSLGQNGQHLPMTNPKLRLRPTQPSAVPGPTAPADLAPPSANEHPGPAILLGQLRRELAEVLYSQEDALDPRRPFVDLGVDSILAIEFVRKISASLDRTVRASDLYDHPNLEALAAFLAPAAASSANSSVSDFVLPIATAKAVHGGAAVRIRAMLARVLYCDPAAISSTKAFSELGLDSILAVEFVRELSREFGVSLSAATLYDHSTLDALTAHLGAVPRQTPPAALAPIPISTAVAVDKPQPEARAAEPSMAHKAVAIIGYSGRFPGAPNLDKFWDNLDKGVCSITPIPADRQRLSHASSRPRYGGFLDDVDRFDPLFFNISPTDAELMDPQHRLFLSEAYRSIENAGYAPESMAGQSVGIYAGVTGSDGYRELLPGLRPAQEMLGAADSILAGRVAYFLDFRGPALTVDTACSSSLVAVHLACRSLLGHETDLALAGGVTLYLTEKAWVEMEHAEMLAPDGLCKTFDQGADGFVPGEGVGVLVLKRLEDALAAGDSIRAVILGTGVNQDGRTNGLTAPSAKSQAALEAQVYRNAGVDPATITCVEAHGTGTKLGDPIEVEGLTRAFRDFTGARQFCAVGSVKTNIGHTTAAAGVAGVLKMAGAFERGHIPPTLHCTIENEHIDFAASPFFVNRELRAWKPTGAPRRAAVSSFGFSGTNAHLVMEEPPLASTPRPASGESLVLLSARTRGALERRVIELADFLDFGSRSSTLAEVAFTLARGRSHFQWRAAFVVTSIASLQSQLRSWTPPQAATQPDTLLTEMARIVNFPSVDRPRMIGTSRDLYLRGVDLPFDAVFPEGSGRRIALPAYPFERDRCWAAEAPTTHSEAPTALPRQEPVDVPAPYERHYLPTDPEVADHVVDGEATVPGAATLLLVLESARPRNCEVAGINWLRPIPVPPGGVTLRVVHDERSFRVIADTGVVHAEGYLQPLSTWSPALATSKSGFLPEMDFYASMRNRGVDYGDEFRRIESLAVEQDRASAWLLPGSETEWPSAGVLDSALQLAGALASGETGSLRPAALERFALFAPWPARVEARMRRTGENRFDAEVLDRDTGRIALAVTGFTLRQAGPPQPPRNLRPTITSASLPAITPELWTRAGTERAALNRYAAALATRVLPRIESGRTTILPLYQPMLPALTVMAARAVKASTNDLRFQHPGLIRKFDLLDRCADGIPAVLRGEQLGAAVLFEDGGTGLGEIYASSATAQVSNAALARLIAAAKPLDVLEFGAGTGATTRAVLEAFVAAGHQPRRYLFTDISTTLLDAARGAFPSCEFARLDVTKPVKEQQIAGDFDVVFGTNALHVAPDPAKALANLRAVVRPGGLFILNEATEVDDYAVLTFGLTTGWWKAAGAKRIPHSPLLSSLAWMEALAKAGFAEPVDWTGGRAFYGDCGQSIFVASVSVQAEQRTPSATAPEAMAPLMGARDYVRRVLAKVLKIDIDRLEDSISFENYGVDSLVVLEINRAFEKDLGRLPVTLLFENTTVAKLAAYFEREHAAALRNRLAPTIVTPTIPAPQDTRPLAAFPVEVSGDSTGKVAIVGVTGRYPLSPDIDSLWSNLLSGCDAIRPVPDDRWKWQNATGLRTTEAHAREAGYIDGVDRFDPLHFGISPREAVLMDPQQRLFLETAAEALETAGYTQERLAAIDRQVGVFVGVMNFDYDRLAADAAAAGIATAANSAHWSVANRVSFCMNLEGPSLAVDTACSASLSAIHLACESLRRKECRVAIAGGVNLILHPRHLDQLAEAGMLSADDRCRAFGANANGFADGEGVGALVLKPLEDALRDGDTIWAVILGSAMNAGGRTGGFTVPNPTAQAGVARRALSSAGVDPATVSYIEAHGTGTALGDPIEVAGLKSAFGDHASSIAIGSAKSNFGHLESAAGILALTKTVLQIRHRMLAPTLHAQSLNPLIEWDTLPFHPVQTTTQWTGLRRAGVSSFGAGGANAHVIVEEGPPAPQAASPTADAQLFVLSARHPDRLEEYRDRLIAFLSRHPETQLSDLAWTLQAGREAYGERLAVIASTTPQLIAALRAVRIPSPKPVADVVLYVALRSRDLAALAAHWLSGASIDWTRVNPLDSRRWIPAPTYPYARERYWLPCGRNVAAQDAHVQDRPLRSTSDKAEANRALDWLYAPSWLERSVTEFASENTADALLPDAALLIATPGVPLRAWPDSLHPVVVDPMDTDCIERALAGELGSLGRVYFVAGVGVSVPDPLDPAAFEYAQESGVVALFRLVKLLRQKGPRSLELAVITQSLPADSGTIPSPAFAAIDGFVRSVRSEFPEWRVCCFDVCWTLLNDPAALMDAAREEWAAQERNPVRRHGGTREVRVLERMAAADSRPWAWREGGHYLILGGAGGLGLETAAHLCRNARAKVTLLGRRAPDDTLRQRIALETAAGGSVEYVQADATSEASLTEAIRQARERFGPIRGAFHSALVLEDRTIDRMGEAALRRVLDSKSATSVHLARALVADPLDFLLFYSSAESFAGDAGQSNYSAGSTFQDAFARTLIDSGLLPARVINWGYWGSVGAVSGSFYQERLKRNGLDSIHVHEGMQAMEAALAGREPQVLAIKANREVLGRLGLVENPEPDGGVERFVAQIGRLEQRGRLHLLAAFRQAGAALSLSKAVSRKQLLVQLGAHGLGEKIVDALLDVLTRAGLCSATKDGWLETSRSRVLPAWETFGLPHHAKLLRACLDALPAILRGETTAVEVLFSSENAESIAAMYQGDPVNDAFNQSVAEAAQSFVAQQNAQRTAKNPTRILEIGAGTGGTTAAVLAKLHEFGLSFDYTFTDVSPAFLRRGTERFGALDQRLRFALLDVERPPTEQGFSHGQFDLIIAANVLHATRDLSQTLGRVRSLLAAGGELLLNEAVAVDDFLTLTFGLLPGWWAAQDTHRRHAHSALASRRTWEGVLREAGFDTESSDAGDRIFIARARAVPEVDVPVEVIRLALAETLQVPLGRIGDDTLFLDLGMDSLTALDAVSLMNRRLAERLVAPLSSMDVYNFPSVGALARRLQLKDREKPAPPADAHAPERPDPLRLLLDEVARGTTEPDAAVDSLMESLGW